MPALSIAEIEEMALQEIDKRIAFVAKVKAEKQKVDLRNFITILHTAIATGSSPTKKNNRLFNEYISKIFKDEKELAEDDNELNRIMSLVNKK